MLAGKNALKRAMLMEFLYGFYQMNQPEIGRLVGGIDYRAVSQVRKRLKATLNHDAKQRKRFHE